jgi:fumarate hydratase, class I
MNVTLTYPFTEDKVRALRVGDRVLIQGQLVTARDRVHKFLFDGGKSPVDLKDGAIYHCGPVVVRKESDWLVRAAGPTTSMRQEAFTARLMEKLHVRVIIGKGGMGEGTRLACKKFGAVYLHAVGGAGSLLAARIAKVDGAHFLREFGPAEALWQLTVKDFEAVVSMDSNGRSLHRRVEAASARALKRLLEAA